MTQDYKVRLIKRHLDMMSKKEPIKAKFIKACLNKIPENEWTAKAFYESEIWAIKTARQKKAFNSRVMKYLLKEYWFVYQDEKFDSYDTKVKEWILKAKIACAQTYWETNQVPIWERQIERLNENEDVEEEEEEEEEEKENDIKRILKDLLGEDDGIFFYEYLESLENRIRYLEKKS